MSQWRFILLCVFIFSLTENPRADAALKSSHKLAIANFELRDGGFKGPVKDKPIYQAGETLYLTLGVSGFTVKEGKTYLSQDVYVYEESKVKPYLVKPRVTYGNLKWHGSKVFTFQNPGTFPAGNYIMEVIVHDFNSDTFVQLKVPFKILSKKAKKDRFV